MKYVKVSALIRCASRRLGPVAAVTAIVCSLTACVPTTPTATPATKPGTATPAPAGNPSDTAVPAPGTSVSAPAEALPVATPTPTEAEPTADPEVAGREAGGPAYEGNGTEPALLDRGRAASERVSADKAGFGTAARYEDGVEVSTTGFSTGIVDGEGSGVVAGARYVVFTVTVHNGSSSDVDLSAVVPTLQQGEVAGSPLYDGLDVTDFSGGVTPGATATARYAFQLPGEGNEATLYLDLDGVHAPAVFSGSLP